MPALSESEAVEKLAVGVEHAPPSDLEEIYAELFPEQAIPPQVAAGDLVQHIRGGLAAEEIVDLWNVVFPSTSNVWYDEQEKAIRYNEEVPGASD